jgi:orotate phosphoribosyltransferase-like protein
MSTADDFARWALATSALEEARRRDLPAAQVADMLRISHEATETLLRGIVATMRGYERALDRATTAATAQIDADSRRAWRRLDAHAARLAVIESTLADAALAVIEAALAAEAAEAQT